MTTDEVKAYLRQAYKLDTNLQLEKLSLEKLWSSVEYHSPSFDGMGGHGNGDKIGAAVSSIVDREQKYDALALAYTTKYREIEKVIESVGEDSMISVLKLRYLHYMKWEEIADKMHYALRTVHHIHGRALEKIALNCTIAPWYNYNSQEG